DYGRTWNPIFDGQPTGSIGALALAPSNPQIIYVGSGEGLRRPDLSVGDGIYKSTDGGQSWQHLGLRDAQQIGAVIVDPRDPNRVLVAALGHPYGPNPERGVFRSLDGGATWQKVLYKDENTGAIDLAFDPGNPQTVYADLWSSRRPPWTTGGHKPFEDCRDRMPDRSRRCSRPCTKPFARWRRRPASERRHARDSGHRGVPEPQPTPGWDPGDQR